VPAGNTVRATLYGRDVQVHRCSHSAWSLLEPAATLPEGDKTVAPQSRGPDWVSTGDGSAVNASPVHGASVNHPSASPSRCRKRLRPGVTACSAPSATFSRLPVKVALHPRAPAPTTLRRPPPTAPSTSSTLGLDALRNATSRGPSSSPTLATTAFARWPMLATLHHPSSGYHRDYLRTRGKPCPYQG
jgi:hypothetical protein